MARIEYKDLTETSERLREIIAKRPPKNFYRMLAHGGLAAEGLLGLGTALLQHNRLDSCQRELIIIRVGILCRANYEVHQHTQAGLELGVPKEKIDALYDGPDADVFSNVERLLLRYTDTVVLNVKAGSSMFRSIEAILDRQQLVEFHMLIGFYMLVSRFVENFEVDVEE